MDSVRSGRKSCGLLRMDGSVTGTVAFKRGKTNCGIPSDFDDGVTGRTGTSTCRGAGNAREISCGTTRLFEKEQELVVNKTHGSPSAPWP